MSTALVAKSISPDDVKSLLATAERDYRLSNFRSAVAHVRKAIDSEAFRTLKPNKQHDAVKACIKYSFCDNSQASTLEWLRSPAAADLPNHALYVCEWVSCSMGRTGSQYQLHTQIKLADDALRRVFERAASSSDRDAQLTRDMVADVLVNKVLLPHRDVNTCSKWLQDNGTLLSASLRTSLDTAVQARVAEIEAKRKPVFAARPPLRGPTTAAAPTPSKAAPTAHWALQACNDCVGWLWESPNAKNKWKMVAGLTLACAILYALVVERRGVVEQAVQASGDIEPVVDSF